jgi:hypothetical protein
LLIDAHGLTSIPVVCSRMNWTAREFLVEATCDVLVARV